MSGMVGLENFDGGGIWGLGFWFVGLAFDLDDLDFVVVVVMGEENGRVGGGFKFGGGGSLPAKCMKI